MELAGELVMNDQLEQAEDVIEQELKQRPTSAAAIYEMLGEAYADKGRREEAIEAFTRSVELNPSDGPAKTFFSRTRRRRGGDRVRRTCRGSAHLCRNIRRCQPPATVDVAVVDDHLHVSLETTYQPWPWRPVSEHRFAAVGPPMQLQFETSGDGGVAGFLVEANGQVVRTYQRVDRQRQ